jgi:hypothetical protein
LFSAERSGSRTVDHALRDLLQPREEDGSTRPVRVVDLPDGQEPALFGPPTVQMLVIKRLLGGLKGEAERRYQDGWNLNTLVRTDVAHRLALRDLPEGEDAVIKDVRQLLIDAARTTRKYGRGWMFINQTLSSRHPEIVQQLGISVIGFGLTPGQECEALRLLVGSARPSTRVAGSARP